MYKHTFKHIIDKLVAFIALVILLPLFILTALLLILVNSGSPFFTQMRPGKNGKAFKLIKFKTMNDKKDKSGALLSDAERLTTVGTWVRKLSLDEIPQLLNVLKGDMSLIGPRPLLMEYLPLYSEEQNQRHNVKPGITGWAQINGRNALDWDKKFELDVYYVKNVSALFDLKIIFNTIFKVFKAEGISSDTSATMEKFKGSSKK